MLSIESVDLENVAILRKWEQLEKKIADYKNHRRFTLRCPKPEAKYS